jgi:predicted transcriptional regulator
METQTITFRLDSAKVSTLDALAEAMDRDRTYLLNEAVSAYLEVQQWHVKQIKEGLRQANAGELIDHAKVTKKFSKRPSK